MTDHHGGISDSDIAIIGMAGRFPGAPTLEQFWHNLRHGVESLATFSDEELRAAGVREEALSDPAYVRRGAVLEEMEMFDGAFFGFSPKEAAIMDPQHRHFLECSWHALEHAGHDPARFPGAIGVFGGSGMHAYMMFNLLSHPELLDEVGMFLVRHTGNDKDFLTTRVSYALNLKGPSINVQTACSTSLVAVHVACQQLLAGECDLALAGGATIELPHRVGYLFREGEILAPDGHCRPFDADSAGTVFGSGVGVVALRRLADALADGDHVHAVIKGSAINNDGSLKVGYLAPSVDGQAAAIAEAMAVADVDPGTIGYVETHGTGTAVGDPIEVAALTQAFRNRTTRSGFCAIGSVKANIGHTDTAAGVASLIKTVLMLEHRELAPSLHFRAPNPAIDFPRTPFFVNDRLRPWEASGGPRRAGVSSLGVGGTNAHVVLEEAPAVRPSGPSREWQLLTLSAKSKAALDQASADLARHLAATPETVLADAAFTLHLGRAEFPYRRTVVGRTTQEAAALLGAEDRSRPVVAEATAGARPLAFLFAGGGSQYPGMGRDLYRSEPTYREAIDRCAAVVLADAGFDLLPLLYPPDDRREAVGRELERPSRALPALFATQYAEAMLLRSWGLTPTAMIGHSMGEYTAACLAGVFSLEDGLRLVALRGRLFEQVAEGGMLSVQLDAEALRPLLGADLSLAAVNAPGLTVASGPVAAIDRLATTLTAREVEFQRIHIAVAAHSAMLEPILAPFGAFVRGLTLRAPTVPFVSNLTGAWIREEEATDPGYWVRHLRETVQFAKGVGVVLSHDPRIALVEVGPGRTLATLAQLHPDRQERHLVLSSLPRHEEAVSDAGHLLAAVGRLWSAGVAIDWEAFHAGEVRHRLPLPLYPFEHKRHWFDYRSATSTPATVEPSGRRADLGTWGSQRAWRAAALPTREDRSALDWVVVMAGNDPLGERLVESAGALGGKLFVVRPGGEFTMLGPTSWRARAGHAPDLAAILQAAMATGGRGAIVQAWSLAANDPTSERALGFDATLSLLQAIGEEDTQDPLRLLAVTAGAQVLPGDVAGRPMQALVPAMLRVAAREFPFLSCASVDVSHPPAGSWQEGLIAQGILDELLGEGAEAVAWRGSQRFLEGFEAAVLPPPRSARPALVRAGGTYLITGGLGGLGLACAEELVAQGAGTVVLVSRSSFPAPAEWKRAAAGRGRQAELAGRLAAWQRSGTTVVVSQADVCDPEAMRDLLSQVRRDHGGIHGVVHAAGTLDDAPIMARSAEAVDAVLAPKVAGTLALDQALGHEPLDFFLLYSSISAIAGLPGQVDYAAANAFLDAFAAERMARTGQYTVSIAWPAWRQIGMVADPRGRSSGAPAGEPVGHPLLDMRSVDAQGGAIFQTEFRVAEHWLLDEHRLRSGVALIPGAGYVELARAAFAELVGNGPVELRDVYFVAPFMVEDDRTRTLRVRLQPTGGAFEFFIESPAGVDWEEHARGVVAPAAPSGDRPREDPVALQARCDRREIVFADADHHQHLRFGPRWGALRRLRLGAGEALAELVLDPRFEPELAAFRLHPALLDMATAGAQELIEGYDPARDFYVPVAYGRLLAMAPLPARCWSHIRYRPPGEAGRDVAVFDVTIMAETGDVVAVVEEFTMQRVAEPARLNAAEANAVLASHLPGVERAMSFGVDPEEGTEILRRILEGGSPSQVVVSPHPLAEALAGLAAPLERLPTSTFPAHPVATSAEDQELASVAAALGDHPAVRETFVVAKWDRPGERRLLAYVVYDPAEHATVSELRRHVRARVADELVPPNFVELEHLPRDADGRVPHEELPDPFGVVDDYVAPATETERWLARIWQDVLGVERVGRHDNFFDIGGHSLLGIRVITRVKKETGVKLNQAIMVLHTLSQVAEECDQRRAGAESASQVGAP